MQRAGRFLYLDWAQAKVSDYHTSPDGSFSSLIGEHNGYRKIGVTHSRKVTSQSDGNWEVIDRLDGPPDRVHFFRLHWLLPDNDFEILDPSVNKKNFGNEIHLKTPHGWVSLIIKLKFSVRNGSS